MVANLSKASKKNSGSVSGYDVDTVVNLWYIILNANFGVKVVHRKKGGFSMHRVYKYSFPVEDYFSLELPKGAKILTVQEQDGEPQIWALVKSYAPMEERNFILVGTGHAILEAPSKLKYIGTFQCAEREFVGHLFEEVE